MFHRRLSSAFCRINEQIHNPQNGYPLGEEAKKIAFITSRGLTKFVSEIYHDMESLTQNPWHKNPREMLFDHINKDCFNVDKQKAFKQFEDAGLTTEIDLIVTALAIKQAKEERLLPITINIHLSSMADPDFWKELDYVLADKDFSVLRDVVIFEALENEITDNLDFSHLDKRNPMSRGYAFAIDDLDIINHPQRDLKRLKTFQQNDLYIQYVKLDGQVIMDGIETPELITHSIEMARSFFPDAIILAEFVQNPDHAKQLEQLGVQSFQGRYLKPDYDELQPTIYTEVEQPLHKYVQTL